jgi:hypothetical protein
LTADSRPPFSDRRVRARTTAAAVLLLLAGSAVVAAIALIGRDLAPTETDAVRVDLSLHGPSPVQSFDSDGAFQWRGYLVRLCIHDRPGAALTYVGSEAALRLDDGGRAEALNGHARVSGRDTPAWLADVAGWVGKATLANGECVEGWLIFGVPMSARAVELIWHGAEITL